MDEAKQVVSLWQTDSKSTGEIIKTFEKENPDIKIEIFKYSDEVLKSKISMAASNNSLPDVFMYWSGQNFLSLCQSQNIADLSEFLVEKDIINKIDRDLLNNVTLDSKIFGVPHSDSGMVLLYNKSIFNQLKLAVPENYSEFMAILKELNKSEIAPISVGAMERWPLLPWFAYPAQQIGSSKLLEEACAGKTAFDNDAFVQAGNILKEIAVNGFAENFSGMDSDQARTLFLQKKAAMIIEGPWNIAYYQRSDIKDDIGFMDFPKIDDDGYGNTFLYSGSILFSMSHEAYSNPAAVKFFEYLIEERFKTAGAVRESKDSSPTLYKAYHTFLNENFTGKFLYLDQSLPTHQAQSLLDAVYAISVFPESDIKSELSQVKFIAD